MNKAIFLDKDGTLIHDVPYNVDPERIVLQPGVGQCLRALQQNAYKLVLVSNQSGVARGYFTEHALKNVERKIQDLLALYNVKLDGFYYCPHHPQGTVPAYAVSCTCRKPMPGMLLKAAKDLGLSLPGSWMVGDILDDVEAGNKAGCRTILINNGNETEWVSGPFRQPTQSVKSITEIADVILP